MKTQSKNPKRSSKTRNKVRTGCEEDSNYKSLLCERCSEEEGKVISSVHSIIKTETNTWGSHTVRPQRKKEKIKVLGSYRLLDGFLIMKDDSICRSLRLVTVKKSLESRSLALKERLLQMRHSFTLEKILMPAFCFLFFLIERWRSSPW